MPPFAIDSGDDSIGDPVIVGDAMVGDVMVADVAKTISPDPVTSFPRVEAGVQPASVKTSMAWVSILKINNPKVVGVPSASRCAVVNCGGRKPRSLLKGERVLYGR